MIRSKKAGKAGRRVGSYTPPTTKVGHYNNPNSKVGCYNGACSKGGSSHPQIGESS